MRYFGTILSAENEKEWVAESVRIITERIIAVLNSKDRFTIALSGGTSPERVFMELACSKIITSDLWERVDVFWVDERLVARSDPESNAGNALKILGHLPARFIPMYSEDLGEKGSLELYKSTLHKVNLINGIPSFDLVLLGMGEDGHTASLFSETEGFNEQIESVLIHDVPQLGKRRMTLTFRVLKQAQQMLILFHGQKKIKILQDLLHTKDTYAIAQLLHTPVQKTWIYYV